MSDWEEIPTPGGHDDWEEIDNSALHPPPAAKAGMSQAALEHFGNGAALGYLPHLQAAAETAGNAIGEAKDKALDMVGLDHLASIDHQLRKQGFKLPDESYLAARDANIKRLEKEAKDNPMTARLSGTGGALATGIATSGLMPTPAATALARVRQAAMVGAGTGLAVNPGDQQGVINPVQLQDRAVNGLIGAGTGAAIQGTGEALTSKPVLGAVKSLGEKLGDLGRAVKGTTPAAAAPIEAAAPAASSIIDPATNAPFAATPAQTPPPAAEPYFKSGDMLPTAIKYGPKVLGAVGGGIKGYVAGEALSRAAPAVLDKASKFLMQSPRFADLAAKNPQAFNSLAARLTTRNIQSGPNQAPVDEEQSRQAFLQGN